MHFVFLSDNMKFSGGRKLLFEYASFMRKKGHQVDVLVQTESGALSGTVKVSIVKDFSPANIPECDKIVATTPREVRQAWKSEKGDVVHFCQGFEITDLQQRVNGDVLPPRLRGSGFFHKMRIARKKRYWKKKIAKIDAVYRLPTTIITVSKHLKEELEERYQREVHLCVNGIHEEFFFPEDDFKWGNFSVSNPLQIINIGPLAVTFKGIETTLKAIAILKEKGLPIKFTRVAPAILPEEKNNPLIDKFYESVSPEQLGELIRSSHIYISNSTEGEGFGLPALEALSSGTVAVLSSICSYKNFSDNSDFCFFVPERDAEATVITVENIMSSSPEEICEIRKKSLSVAAEFSFARSCSTFENILLQ
jgi:L-malate glycosyltransferase